MRRYWAHIVVLFVAVMVVRKWVLLRPWPVDYSAPLPTTDPDPLQEPLDEPDTVLMERGGQQYRVHRHHRYEVVGELLSSETYALTFRNPFYDVDMGLIWGPRIDDLKARYQFRQTGRWLIWRSNSPVSDEEQDYITAHIGNHHVIPAEGRREVSKALRWASAGDLVRLSGYLVDITDEHGHPVINSSRTRTDTGNGACEVVWVEEIQINHRIYR